MQRTMAGALAATLLLLGMPSTTEAQTYGAAPARTALDSGSKLYTQKLPSGREATVYSSGIAEIVSKKQRLVEYRTLPGAFNRYLKNKTFATDRLATAATLSTTKLPAYVPGRVLVVFSDGVTVPRDVFTLPNTTLKAMSVSKSSSAPAIVPQYSTSSTVNTALARLRVDGMERIGRSISRSAVQSMRFAASARTSAAATFDVSNAYRVHLAGSSVMNAVRQLRRVPGVAYVSPDFTVRTMNTPIVPIPTVIGKQTALRRSVFSAAPPTYKLPQNYAVAASAQPMLNATGVNAVAAFDEIFRRYGQLPGQGITITNVSIGDLDDASAANLSTDPCRDSVSSYGPTTRMVGGQRYIDFPSMPLIPAYTAAPDGTLSGSDEVCGTDPFLDEIGLDFSVMAPLPHDQQRGGAVGDGFTDLIGIAPGASYRLVVPKSASPATSDLIGAFLGAANQTPAPNVITASLGYGMDVAGFPGRFLEDDPLMTSVISQIVNGQNIVVVLSANDGTRTYTNVSIGPSGGSIATNLASASSPATGIGDVALSTADSYVGDSGAIDVGSTTLDDILAFNPADPANVNQQNIRAVPETRFTGFTTFSSGFGSRVNVSAPGDNIVALTHHLSGDYNNVDAGLSGGTSASAPEVAAAAAVLLQVARLSGHPFERATDVRSLLQQTATPVVQAPQADRELNVGSQIDLGHAVEQLLSQTGMPQKPAVPRVAIMHRKAGYWNLFGYIDTLFVENTDPAYIDLAGPVDPFTQQNSGENAQSYLTIAPDWEALPTGTKFELTVTGTNNVLSTERSARLLPETILQAAGQSLVSPMERTVSLTYRAYEGLHNVVSTTFQLTFGPAPATSELVHAPVVQPVVTGPVMTVNYDFSTFPSGMLSSPAVMVSFPGRTNTATGNMYFVDYMAPVPPGATKGSITVPVSALSGDGMYGVQLVLNRNTGLVSDFTPVRVSVAGTDRPAAPVFVTQDPATHAEVTSHYLETGYGDSFTVSYDVSNVAGATGAILEISAPGNNFYGNQNPFNNPNGSAIDYNHLDTGSVYRQVLYGTKGRVTLKESDAQIVPGLNHTVRVIPLKGSQPAGEASGVSYLAEDGIMADDGGMLYDGYGINPNGNDGLLTSFQPAADGAVLKSVQRFSQDTMTAGPVLATDSTGCDAYFIPANGIFGGDAGLVERTNSWLPCSTLYPITYSGVPDAGSASALGTAVTPPLATPTNYIYSTSSISGAPSGKGAFLTIRWDMAFGGPYSAQTFLGDVGKNKFDLPIDLDPLNLVDMPIFEAMDYDSVSGMGYIAVDNLPWFGMYQPTTMIAADYANGTATSFQANGCGNALDFELDPSTHTGVLVAHSTACDSINNVQIINLTSKFGRSVPIPNVLNGFGPTATLVSADPVNHLFFLEVPFMADASYNNNALSAIVEMDETGNVRSEMENFNFMFMEYGNHFFQVNPALRRGFVFGPNFMQIQPFSY